MGNQSQSRQENMQGEESLIGISAYNIIMFNHCLGEGWIPGVSKLRG